ncbi:MAG: hypothetical protein LBE20_02430 [Deltaproteobacteria bacterium]|jgi:deoxyadenosine/deoxycytidine kinase|nr:hypothetical protein [Deltaproteobacteria bacterium]
MKMIIIYGPPGVGKLTVAKKLALKTKFKLFHHHLTVDLLASFFEVWSKPFWAALDTVRVLLFTIAADSNLDIIFTFVYESGDKDCLLRKYIDIYEKRGGTVYLVQLKASLDALKARIAEPDRKNYLKLYGTDALKSYLSKINPFLQVPERDSFVIDNTTLSIDYVVEKIITSYDIIISNEYVDDANSSSA